MSKLDPEVCNSHGICISNDECLCDNGYFGLNCLVTQCFNVYSNETTFICSGNGKCVSKDICICDAIHSSYDCSNECSKKGYATLGKCVCDEGYIGYKCEYYVYNNVPSNDSKICNHHGFYNLEKQECVCYYEYYGDDCSKKRNLMWKWLNGKKPFANDNFYCYFQPESEYLFHKEICPLSRLSPIGVKISDKEVIIGYGCNSGGGYYCLNDLFLFDVQKHLFKIIYKQEKFLLNDIGSFGKLLNFSSTIPGSRYGSTTFEVGNNSFVLFGGRGFINKQQLNSYRLNDMYLYNYTIQKWMLLRGDENTSLNHPGDYSLKGVFLEKNIPCSRYFSGYTKYNAYDNQYFVFGGTTKESGGLHKMVLNDLHQYDYTSNTWKWLSGEIYENGYGRYYEQKIYHKKNIPPAKCGSILFRISKVILLLFGGSNHGSGTSERNFSDLMKFNLSNNLWMWVSGNRVHEEDNVVTGYSTLNYPPSLGFVSGEYFEKTGELMILMGRHEYDEEINSIWMYNTQFDEWYKLKGNDQLIYGNYDDIGIGKSNSTLLPETRSSGVSFFIKEKLYLFGGTKYRGSGSYNFINNLFVFGEIFVCDGVNSDSDNVCSGNGNCSENNKCICSNNYYGVDCSVTKCFNIWSNDSQVCNGNGYCITFNKCICNSNYEGSRCGMKKCNGLDEENNICNGHGECVKGICLCSALYSGDYCEDYSCFGVEKNETSVCNSSGKCISYNKCECSLFMSGIECENKRITRFSSIYGSFGMKNTQNVIEQPFQYNKTINNSPACRYGSLMVTIKENNSTKEILVFGGYLPTGSLNDVWFFNFDLNLWKCMDNLPNINIVGSYGKKNEYSELTIPSSRYSHSGIFLKGILYVFGGQSPTGTKGDFLSYDKSINLWSFLGGSQNVNSKGDIGCENYPSSRLYHSIVKYKNENSFLLFGGLSSSQFQNDLYLYNVDFNRWEFLFGDLNGDSLSQFSDFDKFYVDNSISGRRNCGIWTSKNSLWVFGGFGCDDLSCGKYLNDLIEYNFDHKQWAWRGGSKSGNQYGLYHSKGSFTQDNYPGSRERFASEKVNENEILLYGGYGFGETTSASILSDFWLYNVELKKFIWIDGSNEANPSGEVNLKYGLNGIFQKPEFSYPGGRYLHSISKISENTFVIFGGIVRKSSLSLKNDIFMMLFYNNLTEPKFNNDTHYVNSRGNEILFFEGRNLDTISYCFFDCYKVNSIVYSNSLIGCPTIVNYYKPEFELSFAVSYFDENDNEFYIYAESRHKLYQNPMVVKEEDYDDVILLGCGNITLDRSKNQTCIFLVHERFQKKFYRNVVKFQVSKFVQPEDKIILIGEEIVSDITKTNLVEIDIEIPLQEISHDDFIFPNVKIGALIIGKSIKNYFSNFILKNPYLAINKLKPPVRRTPVKKTCQDILDLINSGEINLDYLKYVPACESHINLDPTNYVNNFMKNGKSKWSIDPSCNHLSSDIRLWLEIYLQATFTLNMGLGPNAYANFVISQTKNGCNNYHFGAYTCVRSKPFRHPDLPTNQPIPGNQCCYDKNGILLTDWSRGTVDYSNVAGFFSSWGKKFIENPKNIFSEEFLDYPADILKQYKQHQKVDVGYWTVCCGESANDFSILKELGREDEFDGPADQCIEFMDLVSPVNAGVKLSAQSTSSIAFGDPHLKTFDGNWYTFNGVGEYQHVLSPFISIQVRLSPFRSASFISGISMNIPESDTISYVSGGIYINNELALFQSENGCSYPVISAKGVEIYKTVDSHWNRLDIIFVDGSSFTVRRSTRSFIRLSFSVSISNRNFGKTRGLLGTWDFDKENDFTLPNGEILSDIDDEGILFFGNSWKLSNLLQSKKRRKLDIGSTVEVESLFFYNSSKNESVGSFDNTTFLPVFDIAFANNDLIEVTREKCSKINEAVREQCVFDAIVTSENVSDVIESTSSAFYDYKMLVPNRAPFLNTTIRNFMISSNKTFVIGFEVLDHDGDDIVKFYIKNAPDSALFNRISSNQAKFEWLPEKDLSFEKNSNFTKINIELIAQDSGNMTSTFEICFTVMKVLNKNLVVKSNMIWILIPTLILLFTVFLFIGTVLTLLFVGIYVKRRKVNKIEIGDIK